MTKVRFQTPRGSFEGILNARAIARALKQRLPITAVAQRWGHEVYFKVPVAMSNTRPTVDVEVGDIAYWPAGPCLCIFFGKTPASTSRKPRPASPVTIVGHTQAPVALLRLLRTGTRIVVDHERASSD